MAEQKGEKNAKASGKTNGNGKKSNGENGGVPKIPFGMRADKYCPLGKSVNGVQMAMVNGELMEVRSLIRGTTLGVLMPNRREIAPVFRGSSGVYNKE
jgi:hypothetical protein